MSDEVFLEKQMLYSRPQKIPLFRLIRSGNHRYIDFKCSGRNMRRKNKEARSEQIRINTFFAMLLDEDRWKSGELFYTPRNHLPMFRMLSNGSEHWIEVENHSNGDTASIPVVAIFLILLDEKTWKAA